MTTAQQQLVLDYVSLADKLAGKRKRTLPKFVDIEELRSAAYMGLVEAAGRYDAAFGVLFSTFAYRRIMGAMQDHLRAQGFVKEGERSPFLSLDSPIGEDGVSLKDTVEARSESNVGEAFEAVTVKLDPQAKAVLWDYFIDEHSMKEVGEKFGVSESRISQLVKSYKDRIRQDWSESELRAQLAA